MEEFKHCGNDPDMTNFMLYRHSKFVLKSFLNAINLLLLPVCRSRTASKKNVVMHWKSRVLMDLTENQLFSHDKNMFDLPMKVVVKMLRGRPPAPPLSYYRLPQASILRWNSFGEQLLKRLNIL